MTQSQDRLRAGNDDHRLGLKSNPADWFSPIVHLCGALENDEIYSKGHSDVHLHHYKALVSIHKTKNIYGIVCGVHFKFHHPSEPFDSKRTNFLVSTL